MNRKAISTTRCAAVVLAAVTLAALSSTAWGSNISEIYSPGGPGPWTVTGTVTGIVDLYTTNNSFIIRDSTASVLCYRIPLATYTATVGDIITITAPAGTYSGTPQLTATNATVTGVTHGNPVPDPFVVTTADMAVGGPGTQVPLVAAIVTLNSVMFPGGTTSLTTNHSYPVSDTNCATGIVFAAPSYGKVVETLNTVNETPSILAGRVSITGYLQRYNTTPELQPLQIISVPGVVPSYSPIPAYVGDSVLLSITITGSTPSSVTGDLSLIGGSSTQAFADAGGGVYTYTQATACSHASGSWNLPITIVDPISGTSHTCLPITLGAGKLFKGVPSPGGAAPPDLGDPADATRCVGEMAVFSCSSQGGGRTWQWEMSTTGGATWSPISGATSESYSFGPVQSGDEGKKFHCVVSGACLPGDVSNPNPFTTNAATLHIGTAAGATEKQIIISQVYGGGGNTGATYKNDFIELFNQGTTAVTMTNWCVVYAGSDSQPEFDRPVRQTILNGTIQPGHFYLIQEAAGAGGTVNLPTPDATGTIAVGSTGGKVALLNVATPLSDLCPLPQCNIVDFVGYGNAGCGTGGVPAGGTTNTTAVRRIDVCQTARTTDHDDFQVTSPVPHNSATNPAPAFSQQPVNINACVGGTATFSLYATGTCLTYQWQMKPSGGAWGNVGPSDPAAPWEYTTPVLTGSEATNLYHCVVTTPWGAATSNNVSVTFLPVTGTDEQIVISQFYGDGGWTGEPYKNDFIELHNVGTTAVDVTGWTVQYASDAGTDWSNMTALSGIIPAGAYYLISGGSTTTCTGCPVGAALPTPDVVGSINMGYDAGKVALVKSSGMLDPVADPTSDCRIVDFVGYGGTANAYLGSGPAPSPATAPNTAALRTCTADVNNKNNATDYAVGSPRPRNLAGLNACPADFDGDGHVSGGETKPASADFAIFLQCMNGPGRAYAPGCSLPVDCNGKIAADFDKDGDVDADDFGVFQRCYSGLTGTPAAGCAN